MVVLPVGGVSPIALRILNQDRIAVVSTLRLWDSTKSNRMFHNELLLATSLCLSGSIESKMMMQVDSLPMRKAMASVQLPFI